MKANSFSIICTYRLLQTHISHIIRVTAVVDIDPDIPRWACSVSSTIVGKSEDSKLPLE